MPAAVRLPNDRRGRPCPINKKRLREISRRRQSEITFGDPAALAKRFRPVVVRPRFSTGLPFRGYLFREYRKRLTV